MARGGTGKVVWESVGGGVGRLILEVRTAVDAEGKSVRESKVSETDMISGLKKIHSEG